MNYVEYGLSRLLSNVKGRDDRLFSKGPAFSQFPHPTITVDCPEVGPSGSQLHVDHSADGAGRFPSLQWDAASPKTKQFLLISEDPDAPLAKPVVHGIYYGIPPNKTGVTGSDFEQATKPFSLKGGFFYGKNRRDNVYLPPKPMLGHGPHRYFYILVALSQLIDGGVLGECPTIEEVGRAIDGNVVGWGEWVGVYERKWK